MTKIHGIIITYVPYFTDGPNTGDIDLFAWYYGRVEVFLSDNWFPVTDTSMSWTLENSKVVCRELGYNG